MIEITDYDKLWDMLNAEFELTLLRSEIKDLVYIVHKYSKGEG